MKKRAISGLGGIIAAYLFIHWGGIPFFLLVMGIMTAAMLEYYRMCLDGGVPVIRWWGVILAVLLLSGAFFSGRSDLEPDFARLIITASVALTFFVFLFSKNASGSFAGYSLTLTGVFYIGWLILHGILLREIRPFGREFMLTAALCTWSADTGAYITGKRFGRARLHPVSPNKTRAGAAGSVVFAVLTAVVLKYVYGLYFITPQSAAFLGLLIGVFSIAGDLAESVLKRSFETKDSGEFLPGHGGFLDRIDSLLFTVPLVYYYALWVLR